MDLNLAHFVEILEGFRCLVFFIDFLIGLAGTFFRKSMGNEKVMKFARGSLGPRVVLKRLDLIFEGLKEVLLKVSIVYQRNLIAKIDCLFKMLVDQQFQVVWIEDQFFSFLQTLVDLVSQDMKIKVMSIHGRPAQLEILISFDLQNLIKN